MGKIQKVTCFNDSNIPYALSNICFRGMCTAAELSLKLKEVTSAEDMVKILEENTGLTWKLVKEDDSMIQCGYKDSLGNTTYVRVTKKNDRLTDRQEVSIKNCLLAHGLDKSEIEECLEEITLILFGE